MLASGKYEEARKAFQAAGEYKDASARILESHYAEAEVLLANGEYEAASKAFQAAGE